MPPVSTSGSPKQVAGVDYFFGGESAEGFVSAGGDVELFSAAGLDAALASGAFAGDFSVAGSVGFSDGPCSLAAAFFSVWIPGAARISCAVGWDFFSSLIPAAVTAVSEKFPLSKY